MTKPCCHSLFRTRSSDLPLFRPFPPCDVIYGLPCLTILLLTMGCLDVGDVVFELLFLYLIIDRVEAFQSLFPGILAVITLLSFP